MRACILVVEDEPVVQELLSFTLSRAQFSVVACSSAEAALRCLREHLPDLLLLDLMLPGMGGLALTKRLRGDKRTRELPIIILTARGSENTKVAGLDAGADDYIVKPFSPRELIARVKTVLRRTAPVMGSTTISLGPVLLDQERHAIELNGEPVDVSPTEFKLLVCLAETPGRVYTREQLLDVIWGDHRCIETRTVDANICRLRNVLGKEGGEWIETVRGAGYRVKPLSAQRTSHT